MIDQYIQVPEKLQEKKQKASRARSLAGSSDGRPDDDFYPTPPYATISLLKAEKFIGNIWEPACGDGAISNVLIQNGLSVISTDLNYRGYGEGNHNFLTSDLSADNIITNPPYILAEKFVRKSLSCTTRKVAMLCKLAFLETKSRKTLFEETPLKTVHVFSKRLTMTRNGIKMKNSGMIAFAWFVWDHSYSGKPTISWI